MRSSHRQEIKIVAILLSLIIFPILVTLFLSQEKKNYGPISTASLDELSEVFKKQGFKSYFKAKSSLKDQISQELKNNENKETATNIAIYLFPDLLPGDHFEKEFAEENFLPLQLEMEKRPAKVEAEALYEKLHARVWNYENPQNTPQGLSDTAEKMLKIYQALAWNQWGDAVYGGVDERTKTKKVV